VPNSNPFQRMLSDVHAQTEKEQWMVANFNETLNTPQTHCVARQVVSETQARTHARRAGCTPGDDVSRHPGCGGCDLNV